VLPADGGADRHGVSEAREADVVPSPMESTQCPGCGVRQPHEEGPTHRYLTSSAVCWRAFGELLATCYGDENRLPFCQLVVDAYAAQHPGQGQREQVQSVGIHLMTLCMFLEHGVDPSRGSDLHRRMIGRPTFHRLVPRDVAGVNLLHVPLEGSAEQARARAYDWSRAVWDLYSADHDTVRAWLSAAGFEVGTDDHDRRSGVQGHLPAANGDGRCSQLRSP
jgi:hypothetical protein